ncbi:MAG: FliM/FliN family flagellar motor switch protein [Pseudomonas sp.]|uniref:FliM/FliN family flagellar motor switch protein n=1 Tax=Stenotrophomonas sp. TaxID=69392 RepID=UPI003D6D7A82
MDTNAAAHQTRITRIDLPDHATPVPEPNSQRPSLELLHDVTVVLEVRLGVTETTVKTLMDLRLGATVELSQHVQQDVDVLLNGRVIARGEIVAVDDHFGVRITELAAT